MMTADLTPTWGATLTIANEAVTMYNRVSYYDIHNNKEKAWNTLADQIGYLQNDLSIMCANGATLGTFPKDIKKRLHSLQSCIQRALDEDE